MHHIRQQNATEWDRRATREGLHAVFTTRWSQEDCEAVNAMQQQLIFSSLPNIANFTVLDLGCGIGRLTASLGERAKRVVGIDVSAQMLRRAQTQAATQSSIALIQASAGFLPFRDVSFDVIIASYVLQHILDDTLFDCAVGEIARVLRPGGLALLVDALGDQYARPANSIVTVIRTWSQYASLMKPAFQLLDRRFFRCVEDDYTLMLWERRK